MHSYIHPLCCHDIQTSIGMSFKQSIQCHTNTHSLEPTKYLSHILIECSFSVIWFLVIYTHILPFCSPTAYPLSSYLLVDHVNGRSIASGLSVTSRIERSYPLFKYGAKLLKFLQNTVWVMNVSHRDALSVVHSSRTTPVNIQLSSFVSARLVNRAMSVRSNKKSSNGCLTWQLRVLLVYLSCTFQSKWHCCEHMLYV